MCNLSPYFYPLAHFFGKITLNYLVTLLSNIGLRDTGTKQFYKFKDWAICYKRDRYVILLIIVNANICEFVCILLLNQIKTPDGVRMQFGTRVDYV